LPNAIRIFDDDLCNDEQLRDRHINLNEEKTPRRGKQMNSYDTPVNEDEFGRPLYVSIEMVANLVYLARHSEEGLDQQRLYLDRASSVLLAMRHHPDLPR
jgi:hypothetical protein